MTVFIKLNDAPLEELNGEPLQCKSAAHWIAKGGDTTAATAAITPAATMPLTMPRLELDFTNAPLPVGA